MSIKEGYYGGGISATRGESEEGWLEMNYVTLTHTQNIE
jgi:hypothetical protein